MAAAATARGAVVAPAPRTKAPARRKPVAARTAPARKAPLRRQPPSRRPGGQLIPLAVGTATAVRNLPDSGLMVRMTRGRVWIGVLGVLLAGIVALNVVTLSIAASAGHIDRNIQALDQENPLLRSRHARLYGAKRIRHDAGALGLTLPTTDQIGYVQAGPDDVETAAKRLAAASY